MKTFKQSKTRLNPKALSTSKASSRKEVLVPTSLEGKKQFFSTWIAENKIPGKIQAWFSKPIDETLTDWRIINELQGKHHLLKIISLGNDNITREDLDYITKQEKNKEKVTKYGKWGLYAFVAIPLPGTGAWTGALIASFLNFKNKDSFIAIAGGVVTAGVIMTAISYLPKLIF